MALNEKYKNALRLGEDFKISNGYVKEENGVLKVGGKAKTAYEKNLIWDEIKKAGGENPTDIEANIEVEVTEYFHKHTVKSGDTLGKISKQYYGKAGAYMHIFEANTDQLKNPDRIQIGQVLTIPNPQ